MSFSTYAHMCTGKYQLPSDDSRFPLWRLSSNAEGRVTGVGGSCNIHNRLGPKLCWPRHQRTNGHQHFLMTGGGGGGHIACKAKVYFGCCGALTMPQGRELLARPGMNSWRDDTRLLQSFRHLWRRRHGISGVSFAFVKCCDFDTVA